VPVRPAVAADVAACQGVVRSLPDHFTPDVVGKVGVELLRDRGFVWSSAESAPGDIAGFVILEQRFPKGAEITWAAVDPSSQRQGIGRALVLAALDAAVADGVEVVEVKTLDASAGYEPYVATRAFWESLGFVQVDTIDPQPGWQPGNPSAIYVLPLARR
jgi:ribosomal protein S18 acetylase RimI-like enzyme